MKPSEILQGAKQLLCEKGWCQGNMAKDRWGGPVATDSPAAVCFCSEGAIRAAGKSDTEQRPEARGFFNTALRNNGISAGIIAFNDMRVSRREEVVAMFDEAITEAQKHGR